MMHELIKYVFRNFVIQKVDSGGLEKVQLGLVRYQIHANEEALVDNLDE